MWKWIKSFKKKDKGFTGFKIELYREGKLMLLQRGHPSQIICFSTAAGCGPMIFKDGARLYGYTLTPHLKELDGFNVDDFLTD